jgi:hypothetical protein
MNWPAFSIREMAAGRSRDRPVQTVWLKKGRDSPRDVLLQMMGCRAERRGPRGDARLGGRSAELAKDSSKQGRHCAEKSL